MSIQFENEYVLRTCDFDKNGNLKPSSILDLFQDIAGTHAEALGIGFEKMLSQDMIWVVTKIKFEVIKKPELHQKIKLKTWPLPPSRAGFQREYFMEDKDGSLLVKGTSDWVLVHSKLRKLIPVKDVYPTTDEFCDIKAFEEKTKRIADFTSEGDSFYVKPLFTDIDMNGHVNNAKYADFIMNAINPDTFDISIMQIDYHHEIQQNSEINIYTSHNNNKVLIKGIDKNNDVMFLSRILLK